MSVEVKILREEVVQVTAENELSILGNEWDRRYEDRPFDAGDSVEFVRDGKQRHVEHFGESHAGKRGIVTSLSDNGNDVKVLAITKDGDFIELWTPEAVLVAVNA